MRAARTVGEVLSFNILQKFCAALLAFLVYDVVCLLGCCLGFSWALLPCFLLSHEDNVTLPGYKQFFVSIWGWLSSLPSLVLAGFTWFHSKSPTCKILQVKSTNYFEELLRPSLPAKFLGLTLGGTHFYEGSTGYYWVEGASRIRLSGDAMMQSVAEGWVNRLDHSGQLGMPFGLVHLAPMPVGNQSL